jgi:hypothetical protein
MPYAEPAESAVLAAYDEITDHAGDEPANCLQPADAIDRLETVLVEGSRRLEATFIPHTTGPWPPEALEGLRALAIRYAADTLRGLRTCIASGAILGVPMPSENRLVSMTEEYAMQSAPTTPEFAGAHPDEVLVDQFAMALTQPAVPFRAGGDSERELVRGSFTVIRSAARLVAAIDDRPELSYDF